MYVQKGKEIWIFKCPQCQLESALIPIKQSQGIVCPFCGTLFQATVTFLTRTCRGIPLLQNAEERDRERASHTL
jgi:uncharacterized paraquat-inducible protein A